MEGKEKLLAILENLKCERILIQQRARRKKQ